MIFMSEQSLMIESLPGPAEGQRILRRNGPIVLSNFFEFQRVVREDASATLILDFKGVPYIDSAAIGALMMGYIHRQKDQLSLLLVGVSPRVRTALQVTKVEQFFQFSETIPLAAATSP
jgi:anti-sigma B factor antagonist